MTEYYIIKDKNTGLYFRGKGANRWGKYFNQATIYRIKGMAEHVVQKINLDGEESDIVSIQITESSNLVERRRGKWVSASSNPGVAVGMKCSLCGARIKYSEFFNGNHNYCHKCGAKMNEGCA